MGLPLRTDECPLYGAAQVAGELPHRQPLVRESSPKVPGTRRHQSKTCTFWSSSLRRCGSGGAREAGGAARALSLHFRFDLSLWKQIPELIHSPSS